MIFFGLFRKLLYALKKIANISVRQTMKHYYIHSFVNSLKKCGLRYPSVQYMCAKYPRKTLNLVNW